MSLLWRCPGCGLCHVDESKVNGHVQGCKHVTGERRPLYGDGHHPESPVVGELTIPDDAWRPSGEPADTRLFATVLINRLAFHLDAWLVADGADPQELDGKYPEDLDALCQLRSGDGRFGTLTIEGREYIVVAYPST